MPNIIENRRTATISIMIRSAGPSPYRVRNRYAPSSMYSTISIRLCAIGAMRRRMCSRAYRPSASEPMKAVAPIAVEARKPPKLAVAAQVASPLAMPEPAASAASPARISLSGPPMP